MFFPGFLTCFSSFLYREQHVLKRSQILPILPQICATFYQQIFTAFKNWKKRVLHSCMYFDSPQNKIQFSIWNGEKRGKSINNQVLHDLILAKINPSNSRSPCFYKMGWNQFWSSIFFWYCYDFTYIFCIATLKCKGLASSFALGSFHKLRLHLGVGRSSEKRVVYYIKSAN